MSVPASAAASAGSAEDRLIARHFAPLASHPGALALTDDAAFISPPADHDLVLQADAVIGGVHFFPDDPPEQVARKALRVNLSDLAAKGAQPLGFLLTLALPAGTDGEWLARLADGLKADAQAYGCPLFGGDSVRSLGTVMISIAAFGSLPVGTMVRRAGARPGDSVLVSGTIGDATLGLKLRQDATLAANWTLAAGAADQLVTRYLLPQPRTELAETVRRYAHAAMDVSDGLVGDLAKLCRVSGVSADVEIARIPLSGPARQAIATNIGLLEAALTGGDDYEIVFTAPPDRVAEIESSAASVGIPIAEIGRVTEGSDPPRFIGAGGQPLAFRATSFSHF